MGIQRKSRWFAASAIFSCAALLAGCSGDTGGGSGGGTGSGTGGTGTGTGGDTNNVTLVTTNSFAISDEAKAAFEEASGRTLTIVPVGSAGVLANQLVLTRDNPLGDAFFGVDNTFISRLIDNNVITPLQTLEGGEEVYLIPITQGDVCINVDDAWFGQNNVLPPTNLNDLVSSQFSGQTVVLNPTTSSPGMAFFLATVAAFGDESVGVHGVGGGSILNGENTPGDDTAPTSWQEFWGRLRANGVQVSDSWSDGYFSDFSGAGEGGQRPIVVSYSSSPASTLNDDGTASTTSALLDTCFRSIEYAGVLQNAANEHGAIELIEFLLGPVFQADLPTQMWVYPVAPEIQLPQEWAQFAPQAQTPFSLDPQTVEANREHWLEEWQQIMFG